MDSIETSFQQNFNSLCMNLGQTLNMIWDMTWSIAHDLWQSIVSRSHLLSTTRKRLPAGRSVSFRSGILFKESAPRRRRNCAKYRIKFFFKRENAEKENADTTCYLPTFCNHVFNVRRIVMHLADTCRSPARRCACKHLLLLLKGRTHDSIENE